MRFYANVYQFPRHILKSYFLHVTSNFLTMRSIKPPTPKEAMRVLSLESFPIRYEKAVKIRNTLQSIGRRQLNDLRALFQF